MGVITAVGFLIGRHTDLATLIQLLTTVMVIVQALAQVLALSVLRKRQPTLPPPLPHVAVPAAQFPRPRGLAHHLRIRDKNSPGRHPVEWSLAWLALGCVAFVIWARLEKVWPFGPKEITEEYLTAPTPDAEPAGT